MDYCDGFVFKLDEENPKWKEYLESIGKDSVSVFSVSQYFTKKLKELSDDKINNVLEANKTLLSDLANNSLKLSEEYIENWKSIYQDYLHKNEFCIIAICGYKYIGTPQTCYSFMTKIARKEVNLSKNLTIVEYAELVEALFLLRFGKKPQDCTSDTVEFFIPALQIVVSENKEIKTSDSEITHSKENNVLEAPAEIVIEKNKCFCNRDITVEEMAALIYELRDEEKYKSKREYLFTDGDECKKIRHNGDTKLKDSIEIKNFTKEINKTFSAYGINSCIRKIHMIAQCYCESFRFLYTSEINGKNSYKGGIVFKGRGLIQLTHDYTYLAYYDYKNSTDYYKKYQTRETTSQSLLDYMDKKKIEGFDKDFYNNKLIPFAKTVSTDLNKVIDSAGWYVKEFKSSYKLLEKMDKGLTDEDVKTVTKVINGGENGLTERQNYTKWIKELWKYEDYHK